MIVLTSMSDIRTKLLLGTTLASIAMIFVMAAGVDAFDTKATTAIQASGMNGHVTVMAVHPDGSISYSQGDNAIIAGTLSIAQTQLHDGDTASAAGAFECINIGTGDGTTGDDVTPLTTTGQGCDVDGFNITNVGVGEIEVAFTIVLTDLTAGTVTITEATLENAANDILSHVALATPVPAVENTVVTVIYTMTLAAAA